MSTPSAQTEYQEMSDWIQQYKTNAPGEDIPSLQRELLRHCLNSGHREEILAQVDSEMQAEAAVREAKAAAVAATKPETSLDGPEVKRLTPQAELARYYARCRKLEAAEEAGFAPDGFILSESEEYQEDEEYQEEESTIPPPPNTPVGPTVVHSSWAKMAAFKPPTPMA